MVNTKGESHAPRSKSTTALSGNGPTKEPSNRALELIQQRAHDILPNIPTVQNTVPTNPNSIFVDPLNNRVMSQALNSSINVPNVSVNLKTTKQLSASLNNNILDATANTRTDAECTEISINEQVLDPVFTHSGHNKYANKGRNKQFVNKTNNIEDLSGNLGNDKSVDQGINLVASTPIGIQSDITLGKVGGTKEVPIINFSKLEMRLVDSKTLKEFMFMDPKEQEKCINNCIHLLAAHKVQVSSFVNRFQVVKNIESVENNKIKAQIFIDVKTECILANKRVDDMNFSKARNASKLLKFDGWKGFSSSPDRPILSPGYRKMVMEFCLVKSSSIRQTMFYEKLVDLCKVRYDWSEIDLDGIIECVCKGTCVFDVNSYYSWLISEMINTKSYNDLNAIINNPSPSTYFIDKIFSKYSTTGQKIDFSLSQSDKKFDRLQEKLFKTTNDLRSQFDAFKGEISDKIDTVFYGSSHVSEERKAEFATGMQGLVSNVNVLIELPNKFTQLSDQLIEINDLLLVMATGSKKKDSDETSMYSEVVSLGGNDVEVQSQSSFMNLRSVPDSHVQQFNPSNFIIPTKRIGEHIPNVHANADEHRDIDRTYGPRIFRPSRQIEPEEDPEPDDNDNECHNSKKKMFRLDNFKANLPLWHGVTERITPFEFLNDLTNYKVYLNRSDEEMIKGVIPMAMKGSAISWFNLIRSTLNNYSDFEHQFRKEYEGHDYQERIKRSLIAVRQHKNQLPTIFVQNMYAKIQYCNAFHSEQEAIDTIMMQIHPKWKDSLQQYKIRSIIELNAACQQVVSNSRQRKEFDIDNKDVKFVPDSDIIFEKDNIKENSLVSVDPILYREKGAKMYADKKKAMESKTENTFNPNFNRLKFVNDRVNKLKNDASYRFRGKSFNDLKNHSFKPRYNGNEQRHQFNSNKRFEGKNFNKEGNTSNNNKPENKWEKSNFSQEKQGYNDKQQSFQQNKPSFQNKQSYQQRQGFQEKSEQQNKPFYKNQYNNQNKVFCALCDEVGHKIDTCPMACQIQDLVDNSCQDETNDNSAQSDVDASNEDSGSDNEQDQGGIDQASANLCNLIERANDTFSYIQDSVFTVDVVETSTVDCPKHEIGMECLVEISINDRKLIAIFDCGATCNVIDKKMYSKLLNTLGLQKSEQEVLVVGGKKRGLFKTKLYVQLPDQKTPILFDFYVVKKVPFVLIGTYAMEKLKIDILLSEKSYVFQKVHYPFLNRSQAKDKINAKVNRVTIQESKLNDVKNFDKLIEGCKDICDENNLEDLRNVLRKNRKIFSELPANAKGIEFQINFYDGQLPKKLNSYPANPMKRKLIDECIDELIENKLIRKSDSSCSSPCIVVPKPDGTGRFCVDFRKLNEICVNDSYPLPKIEELITNLGKANYFTVIDLTKGYHQIPLRKEDIWKTAFVTHRGLYEYLAMPFGAKNAPACFQRAMDSVLGSSHWNFALVYIDDVIIFSDTMEEHVKHLGYVFSRLSDFNLNVNPKKIQLCCAEFKFLGYVFKHENDRVNMYPNPKKLLAISQYPSPTNPKKVSQLLGMLQYYKNFVKDYAKLIAPMTKLLRKSETKFEWSPDCEKNLRIILKFLIDDAVLLVPNFDEEFEIHTDACNEGIAAVLFQRDKFGVLKPISCRSRKLNEPEKKMCITHKECLAVKYGFEKFRYFIEYNHFKLITDHQALQWLMKTKDLSGKLARWAITIQGFDFEVIYRPGCIHERADALSRAPVEPAPEKTCFAISSVAQNPVEKAPLKSVSDVNSVKIKVENPIISDETLLKAQKDDPFCKEILDYLNNKKLPNDNRKMALIKLIGPDCCVLDGLLLRYIPDWDEVNYDYFRSSFKVIIPQSLKRIVLEIAHDHKLSGHLGRDKTLINVQRYYWWNGMILDIAKFVKTCSICQLTKATNEKSAGETFGYKSLKPFDLISIDILGPYPRATYSGNIVLLVIVDVYSKIVELAAFRNEKTENMVEFVFLTCCRYGFPSGIISDNGPQFVSTLYNGLMRKLGIQVYKSPPYVAKCNPVERTNRNIKAYLRAFIQNDHRSWDKNLPELIFMLRNVIHVSTGFTPSELMFARKFENPLFNRSELQLIIPESVKDFELSFDDVLESMKKYTVLAREMIEKSKVSQKFYADMKHTDIHFKTGDIVKKQYYTVSSAIQNKSASLHKKFEGPYRVLTEIRNNVYLLGDISTGKYVTAAHACQLYIFNSRVPIVGTVPNNTLIPTNRSGKTLADCPH